jgi:hypothetical protein
MKSVSLFCGALALVLSAGAAFPRAALADNANGKPSEQDICTKAVQQGLFPDVASCEYLIFLYGSGENAVDACKQLQEQGLGEAYGINLGQCVSFLQTVNNPSNY